MTSVESIFGWIEHTPLSLWVRGESLFAFPLILTVHTVGMGLLAGLSAAIALRILGLASNVPLSGLAKIYPVMWLALAANFASGVLLLAGYPYKAFSNPVFYLKLGLIGLAIYLVLRIRRDVLWAEVPRHAKALAVAALGAWAGAILSGRLLAYTYNWLLVGVRGGF